MFPTIEVPRPLAEFVMERANIAPGRTGIALGLPDPDPEEERLESPDTSPPDEPPDDPPDEPPEKTDPW